MTWKPTLPRRYGEIAAQQVFLNNGDNISALRLRKAQRYTGMTTLRGACYASRAEVDAGDIPLRDLFHTA